MKRLDVVDALIKGGLVDLNVHPQNGLTPLKVAIETMDRNVVAHLLDKGAGIDDAGSDDWSPLHAAIDMEVEIALFELDTHGTSFAPSSTISALLLERGADPKAKNSRGETPLDLARERGHLAAVALLQLK